jgi:hypothetical protein
LTFGRRGGAEAFALSDAAFGEVTDGLLAASSFIAASLPARPPQACPRSSRTPRPRSGTDGTFHGGSDDMIDDMILV